MVRTTAPHRRSLHYHHQRLPGPPQVQTAIASVRGAVEAEFGHLPDGVDIIHDPNAVDPRTGQPWAARIQNGRITLNAAHLTAQDAVANIEHEAIHDLYRRAMQGDPHLRRQWEALNKVLDQHPDLAQQVAEAGYEASVQAEEISVELAQRLAGTPAASAWSSFVESVRIALNQGLAAGKKKWDTRAAQRMAVRLLGQARADVQASRFGQSGRAARGGGDARYSYASGSLFIVFNSTHASSKPTPKGVGPTGGRLQSHHGLQQEWAIHNLKRYGYSPSLAPTVTLETGVGFPHSAISKAQNERRNARVASGRGKWSSTLQEELQFMVDDLKAAGFERQIILDVLDQQYKMLTKLKVPFQPILF